MGLFRKRGSGSHVLEEDVNKPSRADQDPPPAPSSPRKDILAAPNDVICTVSEHWQWLLEAASSDGKQLSIVDRPTDLPTASMNATEASPPPTPSSRRRRKKPPNACPFRLEIKTGDGRLVRAAHGSSEAFDGLEDKDELVRTLQRCRCDHLELSPPSRLVNWDVTKEECSNVVGKDMPTLLGNEGPETVAVLKEPMGSRGTGIFFVRNAEEIHNIIDEHKREAVAKTNFLDDLIASKGRIPSWVLQAEVRPCLLIRNRRKFHIRTYVVGVERWDMDELIDTFLYERHEVRLASQPMSPEEEDDHRNKAAHVTNGIKETGLLHEMPELKDLEDRLEVFVAQIFSKHLIGDLSRRVAISAGDEPESHATKFVVAGLDIMVTEDKRFYLLEVNVNPRIASPDTVADGIQDHLVGFMRDLMDLLVGKQSTNFISGSTLLAKRESSN